MRKFLAISVSLSALMGALLFTASVTAGEPVYSDEKLQFPLNYRQWVYLTSGFDMSYRKLGSADHHMFDNVFVEPSAYQAFLTTGTWPDKTQLVLEIRGAEGKGSINQSGNFQGANLMGVEVHVKDSKKFPGGWAFFAFGNSQSAATRLPAEADCYACHAQHAAVDTTFVQFYPTLLPIATAKGTLAPNYKP